MPKPAKPAYDEGARRILVIVVPPVDELDLVFSARQLQGRPLTMHVVTTGSVLEVAEVGVLVALRLVTHQIVRQAVRKLQRIFISIIIPHGEPDERQPRITKSRHGAEPRQHSTHAAHQRILDIALPPRSGRIGRGRSSRRSTTIYRISCKSNRN